MGQNYPHGLVGPQLLQPTKDPAATRFIKTINRINHKVLEIPFVKSTNGFGDKTRNEHFAKKLDELNIFETFRVHRTMCTKEKGASLCRMHLEDKIVGWKATHILCGFQ